MPCACPSRFPSCSSPILALGGQAPSRTADARNNQTSSVETLASIQSTNGSTSETVKTCAEPPEPISDVSFISGKRIQERSNLMTAPLPSRFQASTTSQLMSWTLGSSRGSRGPHLIAQTHPLLPLISCHCLHLAHTLAQVHHPHLHSITPPRRRMMWATYHD